MDADLSIFKACADETRLRVLHLLSLRELCVCELVAVLRMPQGKVSRHLAVLKNAGLVTDRREGTWIHYSMAPATGKLGRLLRDYLAEPTSQRALADRERLDHLCCSGAICVPGGATASMDRSAAGQQAGTVQECASWAQAATFE